MDLEHIVPVILAGGEGRRLRPFTNPRKPKPFVKLSGDYNLLQETLIRCAGMAPPVIVCQTPFLPFVRRSVERLTADYGITVRAIVTEPYVRSTAPAIASAVMAMAPHMTFAVFPSDHVIGRDGPLFYGLEKAGRHVLKHGGMVSVGVKPRYASRRFGYMHQGDPVEDGGIIYHSDRFIEKPLKGEASSLIKSKKFLWNTGIFVARVADYLHEFNNIDTWYMECVKDSFEQGLHYENIYELNREFYHELPIMSVDNAILERISNRYVVPFDGYWNDVGTLSTFLRLRLLRLCGILRV